MTKLQAVQEILRRSGLMPPAALDTDGASMASNAERCLDSEELAVQSRGWHYNTRREILLSPCLYTFDNATWVLSNMTLTQVGAFATAVAGQTLNITTPDAGSVVVESVGSADTVTLATSIGANATGVVGAALDNTIDLPSGTISIDTDHTSANKDLAQRGGKLLDLDNNTQLYTDGVYTTYVERIEFGCIPYEVRRYIMLRAAWEFNCSWGAPDRRQAIGIALAGAKRDAYRFDTNSRDTNVFNNVGAYFGRGQRSSYPARIIS